MVSFFFCVVLVVSVVLGIALQMRCGSMMECRSTASEEMACGLWTNECLKHGYGGDEYECLWVDAGLEQLGQVAHHLQRIVEFVRDGIGIGKWAYGDEYEGEWTENERNGQGRYKANGDEYTGKWMDDKPHGTGVMKIVDGNITYDGEWKDGMLHLRTLVVEIFAYLFIHHVPSPRCYC